MTLSLSAPVDPGLFPKLLQIYALYDELCSGLKNHCHKGCALCCTANVTLTSLEAGLMLAEWRRRDQRPPETALHAIRRKAVFRPSVTVNHMAQLCADGLAMPEEGADPAVGSCVLLQDDLCSIYAARPFACRAMQSRSDCRAEGAADMTDWVVSANTLFMQYIEALDSSGVTANMADLLLFMLRSEPPTAVIAANRPIPVLMIPPPHRRRLHRTALGLQKILADPPSQ